MNELKEFPTEDRSVIKAQTIRFSGPLPAPHILEKYEEIEKGAANRIIAMAESQLEHSQDMEQQIISTEIRNETLGIVSGFAIAVLLVLTGCFLIYFNKNIEGFILVLTPIATITGLFLYQVNKKST